ncbi:MAG: NAD(P)/FAD-dependent oxidoreductase [Thermacetogeniaceae bacterium]
MSKQLDTQEIWDLIIVGVGPAGLAAALNGRIREKSTIILAADRTPPRLQKAPFVKNYPGFNGITGEDLYERFYQHAHDMGVEFRAEQVENIYPGANFTVVTRSNQIYLGRTVILATGIQQTRQLAGERELVGRGLGYCTTCDGPLYRNKDVAVLGETPEAEEEVNFMAAIGRNVYYFPLYKGDIQVDQRVDVRREQPQAILGDERVRAIALPGKEIPVDGVFIIRTVALTERLIAGLQQSEGAILVDHTMVTNIPGLFAAGDCTGEPYQIGKAVGEGLTAAQSAIHYLDNKKKA